MLKIKQTKTRGKDTKLVLKSNFVKKQYIRIFNFCAASQHRN